jgi:DNA-binding response OmpR family regulator
MDDLRQFFTDVVTDQLAQIDGLISSISAGDVDQVETLRRIAHSLKGSGATYGFPDVSEAARRVEGVTGDELLKAAARLTETLRTVASDIPKHRILVIDDDPLIARILEAHLGSVERRVLTASTLAAGRNEIHAQVPDLVILDLFLPDGDGRTLLSEIRHHEMTSGVPVVMISASADIDETDLKTLGADALLVKPFDPDGAAQQCISILAESGSRQSRIGRSALTSTYRTLLAREATITVAVVVPETHGPGGKPTEGPDSTLLLTVQEALISASATRGTVGSWGDSDVTFVTDAPPGEVKELLDRVRLRLRSAPHPTIEGALASFSAAVVSDDGGRGLNDAQARGLRLALDCNRQGGDRIAVVGSEGQHRRVLLAEDDSLTAALIIHRLEREGFDVIHRADGASAVESLTEGTFGLVVLDVQMPGLDGFQVLEHVRSTDSLSDVPVVMLTAVGSERDVVKGFELGADDYILKPFSPAELTARLKRFTRS